MDSAKWLWTPAAVSAGIRLRAEVCKKFSAAESSKEGEFVRSTFCEKSNTHLVRMAETLKASLRK